MWEKWQARLAGWRCARRKARLEPIVRPDLQDCLPDGISVVIPSRNGRHLLDRLLPGLWRELDGIPSEVIITDNGSDDETLTCLAKNWPEVKALTYSEPLSFARAVNAGIREVRFSRTLLLNNDMVLEGGFFPPLLSAFREARDLFCATAQIFFPAGQRREETGKTVWRPASRRNEPTDFPVWCEDPKEGEDRTWVLYGSGGCSLYDTRKLRALGGMDEAYEPAYVEDLDLGYRGWQHGWPSVFVAGAKLVHDHRATSSRYFSEVELQRALEVNYLRFLAKRIADPSRFRAMWSEAVERLSALSQRDGFEAEAARTALMEARRAAEWVERPPVDRVKDPEILALCSGAVCCFPGREPLVDASVPGAREAAEKWTREYAG
jgi:GT2 family glycosyltransferase